MRLSWVPSLIAVACAACSEAKVDPPHWELVKSNLDGALLSVWGTSATDIWTVGADPDGSGPLVFHNDGASWTKQETGNTGDLWWVFGFEGGPVFMGGSNGLILRYQNGTFEKMVTPGTGTVFGIWGSSATDVWAVGGTVGGGGGGFAWRLLGDTWSEAPGLPADLADRAAIWKVFGRASNDVWMVGTDGLTLYWNGTNVTEHDTGLRESLFTVHASSTMFTSVGGYGSGIILENKGDGWVNVTPEAAPAITGVCLTETGGFAVGFDGAVYTRAEAGWQVEETNLEIYESLHAAWIDPSGGVWAVGGQTTSFPLIRGVLMHRVPGGIDE